MKRKFTLLLILISLTGASLVPAQSLCPGNTPKKMNAQMVHFREDMRKLWEDHIVWTRNVIFNIIDELPGTTEAVDRLLQNQTDIGDAIKPYYGNAAGDQLTGLLYGHITIAASLLTALKNDDTTAFNTSNQQWLENADSIALFLSGANPFWDYTEMQTMLYEHLNLTAAEAAARKNQDYTTDVIAYEEVHLAILEMADMLSCGIITQFWSQFQGNGNRETDPDIILWENAISVEQNEPNPFNDFTEISFYVPENASNVKMLFSNSNGKLVKEVMINQRGESSVRVNALHLRSGVYSYYVVADGMISETRKMIR